jgi:hypothetical protein
MMYFKSTIDNVYSAVDSFLTCVGQRCVCSSKLLVH